MPLKSSELSFPFEAQARPHWLRRLGIAVIAVMPGLVLLWLWSAMASAAEPASEAAPEPIEEIIEPILVPDARTHGKVAVVQWAPVESAPIDAGADEVEAYKQRNREALEHFIREAAGRGAEWVVTPEFGVVGYPDIPELSDEDDNFQSREQIEPYVETVPGPSTRYFQKLADELGVIIHFGLAERDPRTDRYHNTVVAVGPGKNEVLARYRKIHLFDGEEKYLVPGMVPVTYEGPFGKIGIIICSDVYSGHPMNVYAATRVDVLALSTSWAQMNTGMGYFRRGATWAGSYLLAANHTYFPDSGVINPDGSLQSHIRNMTGVAYGYVPRGGWRKRLRWPQRK